MSDRKPASVSRGTGFWAILTAIATLISSGFPLYFWLYPEYELTATLHGPFQVGSDKVEFILLQVENRGRKPLSDVEIWVEKGYRFDDKVQVPPARQLQGIDINAKRSYGLKASGKFLIISVGLLRPGEHTEISIVSKDSALSFTGFGSAYLKSESGLKSSEVIGSIVKHENELNHVKNFWSFMVFVSFFVGLLLPILGLGIIALYWEMHPKEQEQDLLKQLDKVRQRIAKSSASPPGDAAAQ